MSQEVVGNWNVALPHFSSATSGAVLPVVVGGATFAIPLEKVRYVDYPDKLMPLPLASSPVEGLASFNHRPLVQIDVARTLNLKAKNDLGRIVVIGLAQGEVALRVDEVLGFVATTSSTAHNNEKTDGGELDFSAVQDMPLLKLEEVLPWLNISDNATNIVPETVVQKISVSTNFSAHILLVSTGTQVIALLASGIDRIEEIDAVVALRHPETEADGLIKIDNYLFPSRSLARILKCEGGSEKYALIVHGTEQPWALLVEKISRLEQIDCLYSVISPAGARSLWYLNEDGSVVEVIDIKEFFGIATNNGQLTVVTPQWQRSNLPQMSSNLRIEGIRVNCGDTICILPLTLVNRTVGSLGEVMRLRHELDRDDLIPIVDGTMLLEQHPKKSENCNILLSLCNKKQVVLSVDSASLQSTLSLGQWLPLAALPPPTSFLFDAAIYDETEGRWILRVRDNLDAFLDVWATKRALVNSMLGWIDPSYLDATVTH